MKLKRGGELEREREMETETEGERDKRERGRKGRKKERSREEPWQNIVLCKFLEHNENKSSPLGSVLYHLVILPSFFPRQNC